jgi:hypothetical protein
VKVDAMQHFGLEVAQKAQYELQYHRAAVKDDATVSSLDKTKVELRLTVVNEVPKGGN